MNELLSGSLPFRGDNAVEIALKHMREPLPSLRAENPSIPQSIENIIKRATAKNPKNRYESARSMHEDLLTALDESRMDEPVLQYKYPENENDARKKKTDGTDTKDNKSEKVDDKKVSDNETEVLDDNGDVVATKVEDVEDKKNKIVIIVLSVIFIIILIGLISIFLLLPKLADEGAVTVPNCENLKVSACEKKLQAAGFEVNTTIETVASSEYDKNRVVKTDPEKGRSVKKGTVITIYKSAGEEKYILEDYVGQNANSVKTLLETKYNLVVTVEKKEPEDNEKDYDDDEIIGQSLQAGSEVKAGDKLTIYTPDVVDTFPDMVEEGWSVSDVEAFCNKYELILEKVEQETSAYSEGTVIGQSRTMGSTIIKGTTLRITIAVKPKEKPKEKEPEEKPETDGDEESNPNNKTE